MPPGDDAGPDTGPTRPFTAQEIRAWEIKHESDQHAARVERTLTIHRSDLIAQIQRRLIDDVQLQNRVAELAAAKIADRRVEFNQVPQDDRARIIEAVEPEARNILDRASRRDDERAPTDARKSANMPPERGEITDAKAARNSDDVEINDAKELAQSKQNERNGQFQGTLNEVTHRRGGRGR